MKVLYILGNGFDVHHGLPTLYSNFNQYVIGKDPELTNRLENYFEFDVNDQYLWTNFENNLIEENYCITEF